MRWYEVLATLTGAWESGCQTSSLAAPDGKGTASTPAAATAACSAVRRPMRAPSRSVTAALGGRCRRCCDRSAGTAGCQAARTATHCHTATTAHDRAAGIALSSRSRRCEDREDTKARKFLFRDLSTLRVDELSLPLVEPRPCHGKHVVLSALKVPHSSAVEAAVAYYYDGTPCDCAPTSRDRRYTPEHRTHTHRDVRTQRPNLTATGSRDGCIEPGAYTCASAVPRARRAVDVSRRKLSQPAPLRHSARAATPRHGAHRGGSSPRVLMRIPHHSGLVTRRRWP